MWTIGLSRTRTVSNNWLGKLEELFLNYASTVSDDLYGFFR